MDKRVFKVGGAGFLNESIFLQVVESVPLVSVDLVLLNPSGQLLLGLRRNAPARHWWFTPGGRVRKNEAFAACLKRIGLSELGLAFKELQGGQLMGVWDHFYEDSAFSEDVSTHYVNMPHLVRLGHSLDLADLPKDQHSAWRWQDAKAAAVADDVHPYVRAYAKWVVAYA